MLAEIHFLMQWNTHLIGAKTPTKDNKNPAPPPKFPWRPWAPEDEMPEIEGEFEKSYEPVPDYDAEYDEEETEE